MKKKMSTKTAMTGAIIVMIVWFAMWGFGYKYLADLVNDANVQGYVQAANDYLSQDDGFIEQYGQLTKPITAVSEAPIHNEGAATEEYYMDFTCITDQGEWNIRVYWSWSETDGQSQHSLRYEELPAN